MKQLFRFASKKSDSTCVHNFRQDEKGGVALMAAFMLPIIVGLIGLAVEVGSWQSERQGLQSAVDIAAHAGSVELGLVDDEDQARNVAYAAAMLNGMNAADVVVSFEDVGKFRAIRVSTNRMMDRYFTRLYSETDQVELSTTAAAFYEPASVAACILVLGADGSGLRVSGTADLDATGCAIHSNRTGIKSFDPVGGGYTLTECMTLVGTTTATPSDYHLNTCADIEMGAEPMADPYADVPIPETATVDGIAFPNGTYVNHGSGTFKTNGVPIPGGYYTNLSIQATTSLIDNSTFVIDGGIINFKGNNAVTGNNVTIILINGARISMGSQFNLQLSAKTTGIYAGMLVVGDRDTTDIEIHKIVGGTSSQLTGAIYLPAGRLELTGGSQADTGCTQLVAYELYLQGNSKLRNVCDGVGTRTIGEDNPAAVRYVES